MNALPDPPVIRNLMATGYPDGKDPVYPHCPVCGKECETIYRDKHGDIAGCDCCLDSVDAWEVESCFPDDEE